MPLKQTSFIEDKRDKHTHLSKFFDLPPNTENTQFFRGDDDDIPLNPSKTYKF